MSRTARRLRATAVAALAAALPLAALTVPTAHAAEDPAARPGVTKRWGPQQETPGTLHRAVLMRDGTVVDLHGTQVLRRSRDDTTWGTYERELSDPFPDRPGSCHPWRLGTSGASLVVSRACDLGGGSTLRYAWAWHQDVGWDRTEVPARGPQWIGVGDQVGVGRYSWTPETGWTRLAKPPFPPVALAADARGRVTAVGHRDGGLVAATLRPGRGWGGVRVLAARSEGRIRLAVSASGAAAVVGAVEFRTVVWRRTTSSSPWQRARFVDGYDEQVAVDRSGDVVLAAEVHPTQDHRRGVAVQRWRHQDAAPRPAASLQPGAPLFPGSVGVALSGTGLAVVTWGAAGRAQGTWGSRSSGDGWSEPDRLAATGRQVGLALGGGCTLVATSGAKDLATTARLGGRCRS